VKNKQKGNKHVTPKECSIDIHSTARLDFGTQKL